MKIKYIKAKYKSEFLIPNEFIKKIKKTFGENKTLALYSAIQFIDNLIEVEVLLKAEGYRIITSKPSRASVQSQILGCDSYAHNLKININEIDGFVYVGDGYFHPNALLLAQENEPRIKPVVIFNAPQRFVDIIDEKHITKYLKKRKGNLLRFHTSNTVGVFVSSKWGQEYKHSALKLRQQYPEKNFYYFAGDNFLDSELENYNFIQCWVNTACPRIGQDDVLRHPKAVINIADIWKFEFKK